MSRVLMVLLMGIGLVLAPIGVSAQDTDKSEGAKKQRAEAMKAKAKRARDANEGLKVGEKAPAFALKSLDGKQETNLAEVIKEKPMVLIFGSYS
jgi:cytochrome oxidase Cu insertion factor (SCO1/SenC/PrrC family)